MMPEASPRSPEAATPARILLVEDELNMARTLAKNLERAGYEVEHAPHGEAALARLESVTFDVVLTDLKMPVMDGMTSCGRCTSVTSALLRSSSPAMVRSSRRWRR